MSTEANKTAALALAASGIPIFPAMVSWNESARKLDKRPAISGWQASASVDTAQIGEWWKAYPEAVPGIELGKAGLVVIDLDRHPGAPDGVEAFKQICGERRLPNQPVTISPSNGYHVFFKQPNGEPFGNGRGNLPDGIDVRGKGGWVVAPGAVHARGTWRAESKRPGLTGNIPALPPFLAEIIRPLRKPEGERAKSNRASDGGERERKYAEAALHGAADEIAATGIGQRNNTLNAVAFRMGRMVARGWIGRATVEGRLYDAAVSNGLVAESGDHAVRGTIKSGLDAGEREPHEDLRDSKDWRPEEPPSFASPASFAWPEMDPAAYRGLAGDVVAEFEPFTEADPVAILLQVLTYFGNVVGGSPYYQVEADRHLGNLFCVLVGSSAKARKGVSAGRARSVFETADTAWIEGRMKSGLSSGEGLINEVRDERQEWNKKDEQFEIADPGVPDKRLMVTEPEYSTALSVMDRPGNTLSQVIRNAWDGLTLSTLTKNSPLRATRPHISICGHITVDELRARHTRTDAANGYANRFIFALVKRSKTLPFGGSPPAAAIIALSGRIAATVEAAKVIGEVRMTAAARTHWQAVYKDLSEGKPGLLGAVVARGEAQVVRLALIYALMDCSQGTERCEIDFPHLESALAAWEYCETSAAYIFGDSLGDEVADEILRSLRQVDGMTRTDISNHFGRHRSSGRVSAALALLAGKGLARCESMSTGGRPVETWFAVTRGAK